MKIGTRAAGKLGGALIDGLMRTTRFEVRGQEHYDAWWGSGKPVIFVLWHGRLLPCSYHHRHQGLATLVSKHRDGDHITSVVQGLWGFHAIRGSSSRGGSAALREIVKTLRGGRAVAITPDGPRGPRQKMKQGPIVAAQLAGVPLIPASAGSDRAWWVGGWDRFLIPKPFARVRMMFGEPMFISRDIAGDDLDAASLELEERLNEVTAQVDRPWT